MAEAYQGLLAIGDPHVEPRIPGFRKDDYPRVILDKLRWCLGYARENALLPAILGDLFHLPRDNPNWILCELIELFSTPVIAVYGNHDCRENAVNEHDSMSVLIRSGRLRILRQGDTWEGRMSGRRVIVGGTPWGLPVPGSVPAGDALVFWLAHHDVAVPGYEDQGRFKPHEIPGIDVVINGHIHRHLEEVSVGRTTWLTPGGISRRNRSDATREHKPAALRIDVSPSGWQRRMVEVPHAPFDAVFYPDVEGAAETPSGSAFVAGLAELQARRTESGAGLMSFLEKNLSGIDTAVAEEIIKLAREVTQDAQEQGSTTGNGQADDRDADRALR